MKSPSQSRPVSVRSLKWFIVFLILLFGPPMIGGVVLQLRLFVQGASAIQEQWVKWLMAGVFVVPTLAAFIIMLNGRRFFGKDYWKVATICWLFAPFLISGTVIHCRQALRGMVANDASVVALKQSDAEKAEAIATERKIQEELSAADNPSVLMVDNGKAQTELSEEIERLRAQASMMDHDGNSKNDKEIPGILERVATKEAKLKGLEDTAKELRVAHTDAKASIQKRLDDHRSQMAKAAGTAVVASSVKNSFAQFAADMSCLINIRNWQSEEWMLNAEVTFLAILIILADWLCAAGIKGVFVVLERISELSAVQQATPVAQPASREASRKEAEKLYELLLDSEATNKQKRALIAAAQNAGFELGRHVKELNGATLEIVDEEIKSNIIQPWLERDGDSPFMQAAAQRAA